MQYDSDKLTNGLIFDYLIIFDAFKKKKIKLLEIGIFKGGSLQYWADYFTHPETQIVGIDLNIPDITFPENVIVRQCDQNDSESLEALAKEFGGFDIIVDDGAHFRRETENCFRVLWDFVPPGGYYVIEDWAAGYWEDQPSYAGMVELITELIHKTPEIKVAGFNIVLSKGKALAFFRKGEEGWTS